MFIKVYQYHVQKDKISEYKALQQKAANIYKRFIDGETLYLQSKTDETKWIEISKYQSEEAYDAAMEMINKQPEIEILFQEFQSVLVEKSEITEEDFFEIQII